MAGSWKVDIADGDWCVGFQIAADLAISLMFIAYYAPQPDQNKKNTSTDIHSSIEDCKSCSSWCSDGESKRCCFQVLINKLSSCEWLYILCNEI